MKVTLEIDYEHLFLLHILFEDIQSLSHFVDEYEWCSDKFDIINDKGKQERSEYAYQLAYMIEDKLEEINK